MLLRPCEANTIAGAKREYLLVRRDDMLVILVDDFLHLCIDELVEGVQLLPHQPLLIEIGGDDGPRIFLLPHNPRLPHSDLEPRLRGQRFAEERLQLTDHVSEF